eukprot:TRINITY_DN43827_c0_g1_i1.p1 TRINITY_DN43827_c0_g1~~TRINITY_DN43827_c0_g1_i1.p1  ORF type:complete len:387 (-),score=76.58 TRINITY_DN43827_c0_g1_i1:35-1195(-)
MAPIESAADCFKEASVAVAQGDNATVEQLLRSTPSLATAEGAYDEVMESVDMPPEDNCGGIAMAPVIGTLLHVAAKSGRVDIARLLLDSGADVNRMEAIHWYGAEIENRSPLHLSVWGGNPEMVTLLVSRRADVDQLSGPSGARRTPLKEATSRGYTDIARCLLEGRTSAGSEAEVPPEEMSGLLLGAIQAQSKDTVQLLLDFKAEVNGACSNGLTPLRAAARYRCPEIVAMLLEKGADTSQEAGDDSNSGGLLSIASCAKAQLAEWVDAATAGPERDWRERWRDQHMELVKVLLDSGTLQVAPGSLTHVLSLFRSFDQNGDGVITRGELLRVLNALDGNCWTDSRIDRLLTAADMNKDGSIQLEEFIKWIFGGGGGESGRVLENK